MLAIWNRSVGYKGIVEERELSKKKNLLCFYCKFEEF